MEISKCEIYTQEPKLAEKLYYNGQGKHTVYNGDEVIVPGGSYTNSWTKKLHIEFQASHPFSETECENLRDAVYNGKTVNIVLNGKYYDSVNFSEINSKELIIKDWH